MPIVEAKCPSCNGEVQLDDTKSKGFCMHCGNQIEVQEAVQKVKLEGQVRVEGIDTADTFIENGLQFLKLGEKAEANTLFLRVTKQYPGDYRGWFHLAYVESAEFTSKNNRESIDRYLNNAIKTARNENQVNDLKEIKRTYDNYVDEFHDKESMKKEQAMAVEKKKEEFIRFKNDMQIQKLIAIINKRKRKLEAIIKF